MHTQRHRQRLALILGLVMLAFFLFSAVMTSSHALHDCMDESCTLCLSIHTLQSLLRFLASLAACLLFIYACTLVTRVAARAARRRQAVTLISQKIRLNP